MSDEKLAESYANRQEIQKLIDYECTAWADWPKLSEQEQLETHAGYHGLVKKAFVAGLKAEREKSKKLVEALKLISLGEAGSSLFSVERYVQAVLEKYEKEGAE